MPLLNAHTPNYRRGIKMTDDNTKAKFVCEVSDGGRFAKYGNVILVITPQHGPCKIIDGKLVPLEWAKPSVIKGLDEAMFWYSKAQPDFYNDTANEMIARLYDAARAYAELQKGV